MVFSFHFLTACELIVDIEVPFKEAQLTINSFFNADSLWTASLSINQGILDASRARRIENGLVIIYEENVPVDTLIHVVNGVYRSENKNQMLGRSYEIRASASEYKPISGRSHIPMPSFVTKLILPKAYNRRWIPGKCNSTLVSLMIRWFQIIIKSFWRQNRTGLIRLARDQIEQEPAVYRKRRSHCSE
jgi:hypothetical protein